MTKEYGTTDTFYKGDDGRYYKSKEIYDEYIHEINTIELVKKIMYEDFFGYKPNQPGSTWGYKEIAELHKFYKADVILKTIEEVRSNIEYALDNISFNSEYNMMKYIFTIIRNKIKDVNDIEIRRQKALEVLQAKSVDDTYIEPEKNPYSIHEVNSVHAKAATDISLFVGDDE